MRIYKTTHRDIAMSLPLIMRFYDHHHSDLAMHSQQMKGSEECALSILPPSLEISSSSLYYASPITLILTPQLLTLNHNRSTTTLDRLECRIGYYDFLQSHSRQYRRMKNLYTHNPAWRIGSRIEYNPWQYTLYGTSRAALRRDVKFDYIPEIRFRWYATSSLHGPRLSERRQEA
jgi:hypothetical protein